MSDVADRVRKIVVEHLNVDAEKVTEKASFIDDLGADSLDQVELVMAFEEEFSVEIPDDAAESIQTGLRPTGPIFSRERAGPSASTTSRSTISPARSPTAFRSGTMPMASTTPTNGWR